MSSAQQQPPARYLGGQGPPLVLLHGGGGTWRQWEPVIPLLNDRFTVLAPTLAWHWGSGHRAPAAAKGIDTLSFGVAEELEHLGWKRPYVVGGSLGGWVALRLAAIGIAGGTVAISPAGGWRPGGLLWRTISAGYRAMGTAADRWPRQLEAGLRRPGLRRAMTWHHFARPEALSAELAVHFLHSLRGLDGEALSAALDGADGAASAQGAEPPVRFLYPEHDRVVPAGTCRRLQAEIPGADEATITGAGHVAMVDDPPAVAAAIERFAAEHPPAG